MRIVVCALDIEGDDGRVEVAEREPVLRRRFVRCFHQGEFPFNLRRALRLRAPSNRFRHLTRHGLDLLVLPYGGLDMIGFQMGVERFDVIFHDIGALLIGIVGTPEAKSQQDCKASGGDP